MGTPIFTEGFIEAFEEDPSQFIGRTISEHEAYEMYDQMLDECYEDPKICGMSYCTSRALKDVDPIAYRCGFSDYTAHLEEDNIYVEGYTEPPKDS
jgi:hypothetical protein|tara:strand:- start:20 stop:307 length:288 start_codon:yes stop_codon:yes gene_type:complete